MLDLLREITVPIIGPLLVAGVAGYLAILTFVYQNRWSHRKQAYDALLDALCLFKEVSLRLMCPTPTDLDELGKLQQRLETLGSILWKTGDLGRYLLSPKALSIWKQHENRMTLLIAECPPDKPFPDDAPPEERMAIADAELADISNWTARIVEVASSCIEGISDAAAEDLDLEHRLPRWGWRSAAIFLAGLIAGAVLVWLFANWQRPTP